MSAEPGTVGAVGEFGLIARVTARLPVGRATLLGPGDDAAVVAAPDGRVVVSTDLLVEGRHFRRDWSPAYDVGRRAAAANLADVLAMGARPTALVVGLAAPADLEVAWAEALADGLADEAGAAGAGVVGGDVVASPVLTLAVTALGDLGGRAPVTRGGARPGDVVVVAGRLGWAAAGLAVLQAGDPDLADRHPGVVAAHRRPELAAGAALTLAAAGATAMLDVSDGLAQDLGHLAAASGATVVVDARALPVAPEVAAVARDLGQDPTHWVAGGGDDHAFAAALPPGVWQRLAAGWTAAGPAPVAVGLVEAGPGTVRWEGVGGPGVGASGVGGPGVGASGVAGSWPPVPGHDHFAPGT